MNNLTTLNLDDDFFLTDFEPMQARFTQARVKMPSKRRFHGYQKPRYEVKTFGDSRNAVTQIYGGDMNQDLYSTSNGLYRERMRTAQSTRDRCLETPLEFILTANQEQLSTLKTRTLWNTRKRKYKTNYSLEKQ